MYGATESSKCANGLWTRRYRRMDENSEWAATALTVVNNVLRKGKAENTLHVFLLQLDQDISNRLLLHAGV